MKIVFIGSGNLATQLGLALNEAGQQIVQVFSRTEEHASELATKLGCEYTTNIDEITENCFIEITDIYFSSLFLVFPVPCLLFCQP